MNPDRILAAAIFTGIGVPGFAGGESVRLVPSDVSHRDLFGTAVALVGTTALFGAPGDDDQGDRSGSAYLFDTVTARQLAKLLPADGAMNAEFGNAVALRGTTAVVGAPYAATRGAVYVFDVVSGQQLAKLVAADGQQGDRFGNATALYGTRLLVGAPHDDEHGVDSGSCYVFDLDSGQQLEKLVPADGSATDWFGGSVAIYGTTALIGAARDVVMGLNTGCAYVFDAAMGQELAKLVPSDGGTGGSGGDQFGFAVALHGTTALVGARWSGVEWASRAPPTSSRRSLVSSWRSSPPTTRTWTIASAIPSR